MRYSLRKRQRNKSVTDLIETNQSKQYVKNTGVIDPLDIAFAAIGAHQAWGEASSEARERFEGQLAFVGEVISNAQNLADVWETHEDNFAGVWAYDVAEAFGQQYGRAILSGEAADPVQLIIRIAEND